MFKTYYKPSYVKDKHIWKERGAIKRNIPYTLTYEYLYKLYNESGDNCPICGKLFDKTKKGMPTIDRVDPDEGYIPGNVALICDRCNNRKATVERGINHKGRVGKAFIAKLNKFFLEFGMWEGSIDTWGSYECLDCKVVFDVRTNGRDSAFASMMCPKCGKNCSLKAQWPSDINGFGSQGDGGNTSPNFRGTPMVQHVLELIRQGYSFVVETSLGNVVTHRVTENVRNENRTTIYDDEYERKG